MLLLTLLLLLLSAVNASAYGDPCPNSTCGNIPIRYPFYQVSTSSIPTSFCGYPGFALTCNDGTSTDSIPTPILTLPIDSAYVVKHIDYVSHVIKLIDNDVVSGTSNSCPRVRHNLTIDNYPLTNRNLNLAFYFNCSNVDVSIPPIECLTEVVDDDDALRRRRKSYVFEAGMEPVGVEWGRVCVEKVVAAVEKGRVDLGNLVVGYGEAMRSGFVLDWGLKKGVQCAKCENSGGMCGYQRAEAVAEEEFVCHCKGGSVEAVKCKRSKSSLPKL